MIFPGILKFLNCKSTFLDHRKYQNLNLSGRNNQNGENVNIACFSNSFDLMHTYCYYVSSRLVRYPRGR